MYLCVPDVFYYYLVGACYYHVQVYYIVIIYNVFQRIKQSKRNSITKIIHCNVRTTCTFGRKSYYYVNVIFLFPRDSYLIFNFLFSDAPKILRVTPVGGATIGVHNKTIMTCSAEGNPLPKYLWLQKLPSNQVLKRGYNNTLSIEDTTYDHQGEYVCEAVNVIGDQRKVVQSEPLRIEVRGKKSIIIWKKIRPYQTSKYLQKIQFQKPILHFFFLLPQELLKY